MARSKVSLSVFLILGSALLTLLRRVGATGMEAAARGRIGGRRNIALKHYSVHLYIGIGVRYRRKERLSVGMERIIKNILLVSVLHHRAKVHNSDLVRNEFYDRKIVRNKEIGEIHRSLQILKKIDDLRLDRHVKRGDGLIAYDELRIYRKRTRDAYSLSLSARKLVRIPLIT